MVGYVTVGTNDFDRAAAFYDALFATWNAGRIMDVEGFVVWGTALDQAGLALTRPFDGNAATVGNGMMVALRAESKEAAAALHAKAMELGSQDEGAPGQRGEGFYGAYFRDLDGNKLAAYFLG